MDPNFLEEIVVELGCITLRALFFSKKLWDLSVNSRIHFFFAGFLPGFCIGRPGRHNRPIYPVSIPTLLRISAKKVHLPHLTEYGRRHYPKSPNLAAVGHWRNGERSDHRPPHFG